MTIVVEKKAPLNRKSHICMWPFEVDRLFAIEPGYRVFLLLGQLTPVANRIVFFKKTGAIEKILELIQREASVLCIGVCGEDGLCPVQVSLSKAFYKRMQQLALRLAVDDFSPGINSCETF